MNTTSRDKKIKQLIQDGRKLYHTQDLAVLWGINNPNTLYTTIKRYIQRGFLYKVHKGFYSTVSLKDLEPVLLGLTALHGYGYLSTESVLVREGIIFQDVKYITLVASMSKKFEIAGHNFLVRKMKDEYLHNEAGIILTEGGSVASRERAVADMLYFNPKYHFDASEYINWDKVAEIKKQIGY